MIVISEILCTVEPLSPDRMSNRTLARYCKKKQEIFGLRLLVSIQMTSIVAPELVLVLERTQSPLRALVPVSVLECRLEFEQPLTPQLGIHLRRKRLITFVVAVEIAVVAVGGIGT